MLEFETMIEIANDLEKVISELDINPIKYFSHLISSYSRDINNLANTIDLYMPEEIMDYYLRIIKNCQLKKSIATQVSEDYFKVYIV